MRLLLQAGVCCLLAAGAFAQHRGGGGGGFRGGHAGGGYARGGIRYGGGHTGFYSRGFSRFGHFGGRGIYYPYLYPSYFGSWWPSYDYGYDYGSYVGYGSPYGYAQNPNVTVVYPQQPASSVVVVPAYPAPAVMQAAPRSEEPVNSGGLAEIRDQSPLYLIAFQDHVIRAALAYWTEGGTLHYIDMDHKIRQTPLSAVDASFSRQLNQERRVPFRLPGQ